MQIISISGLDGSGKSTQIKLLQEYLESQGKKIFYFHGVQFSIANLFHRQINIQGNRKNITKSITQASWLKIQLRKIALIIDLFRFKNFTAKLENEGYDYILSDRYFYDSIINIAYLSKSNSFLKINVPNPDYSFYLKTDPQDIMKRDRPADQGLAYLQIKQGLYDKLAKKFNLTIIDGGRNKEEISNNILSYIKS